MNVQRHMVRILVAVLLAGGAYAGAPGRYVFEYLDGYCWLEASEAPLIEILAEVSEVTGIPIIVDPSDKSLVTVSLQDRDLEALMKAICSGSTITWVRDEASGQYLIEKIVATTSVDPSVKAAQARELLIRQRQLDEKLGLNVPSGPMQYSGIGARVALNEDKSGVWLRPLSPDAPAAKADIKTGDLVIAINGRPVSSFRDVAEIVGSIRGPAGSGVALRIRQPDGAEVDKKVRREVYRFQPPPAGAQ